MAEFKISRLRYTWRNNWTATTAYKRDDVVKVGGKVYVCIVTNTASANFATDLATNKWVLMNDGILWRGPWAATTSYNPGDLVYLGGVVYICVVSHTSQSTFDPSIANWAVYNSSVEWNSEWTPNTRYSIGDLVSYGGIVYECNTGHTSAATAALGLEADQNKWDIYFEGVEYRGNWDNNVRYKINDLVKYAGSVWKCNTSHTSGDDSTLNFNTDYWTIEIPGQQHRGTWSATEAYGVGDVVRYGGYLYVAIRTDINEIPPTETSAWTVVTKNYKLRGEFSETVNYLTGDVVSRGGNLYVATDDIEGQEQDTVVFDVTVGPPSSIDSGNKYYLDNTYRFVPTFVVGNTYVFNQTDLTNVYFPNDNHTTPNPHPLNFNINGIEDDSSFLTNVVYKLDEQIVTQAEYIAGFVQAKTRTVSITVSKSTPSTLYYWCWYHPAMGNVINVNVIDKGIDPSLNNSWTKLLDSIRWTGGYVNERDYAVNDLVTFDNITYRCIVTHISNESENYPGNGNGFNYWEVYLEGDADNALAVKGDLLTYGFEKDGSSLGSIAVPIGQLRESLTVLENDELGYVEHGSVQNLLYVGPNGIDTKGYGLTPGTPFASIRYACEYAETLSGETKVFVRTGKYFEITPIIVPAFCSVQGEEVRSTTVEAAGPNLDLVTDSLYTRAVLQRLKDIVPDLIQNNLITKITGNQENQVRIYDAGSNESATAITGLIDNMMQYIRFYVDSQGTDVTKTGTNTAVTAVGFTNAVAILEANKDFLVAEIIAYMNLAFPNYNFNETFYRTNVERWINAWKYDIIYTGNYKSLLEARYYRNAVLGCASEDMFYVRNATGVRNMTVQGINGTLSPPAVFELYRRPTGGSYVSLDPGWGPADNRTWITTRSPYIQNVTTFGYAAIGQKIDGALHNGGNKSIVSNDFTQVISDGIGAWVLNGGRAELVSVFTYYAQIGYFAEDGGIIRATNGNNSYGDYGAIADGNDPTETPKFGDVDNRTGQATIVSAFAGEVNDDILLFEFENAGQNYTSATYTILGAGTGADVVQEEFRDNAIFDVHIINPPDSGDLGGVGFLQVGNNAQTGDTTSITIAAADSNTPSELLGMRLIITSGTGTGQYGYIQAYNETTKVATIYRESDDTPGWDHVIPGYPIATLLTTSATYRIEPRPIFSHPGYAGTVITLPSNASWANIVFGETTATYNNVSGSVGQGSVIGDDGLVPVTAVWTVVKNGRSYSVTLTNAGAGYAAGQTVTIPGSSVGGTDGDNDIVITVKSVSNDSTNSIVTFEYRGVGSSGNFVATTLGANTVAYSSDGSSWNTGSGLTSGDWKCLAAGGNRFVAIRNSSNVAAYSLNGQSWTLSTMPSSKQWNSVAYGSGIFVAIAADYSSAAYSTTGATWTDSTLPSIGDSTFNEWVDITYGEGKFVAVANTGNYVVVGRWNGSSIAWQGYLMDSVADSSQRDWVSIAYGNGRFVAVSSTGDISYSFDAETWYGASMPTQDGSTAHNWKKIRYGQGVFFAIGDTGSRDVAGDTTTGATTFAATSEDGVNWTTRTLSSNLSWSAVAFGNPDIALGDSTLTNSSPMWIAVADGSSTGEKIVTGARAKGRIIVEAQRVKSVRIWEPGSGYTSEPTLTVIDPNQTSEVFVRNRLGDGVLAQPSWRNRGSGYKTSSTTVTVSGDGFADVIPVSRLVTLSGLERLPGAGAQFRFGGRTDAYTVVAIIEEINNNGTLTATFQISPFLTALDDIQHGTQVEIRERYSQCRITGHDFLDIGTGNFLETNYPELYSTGLYTRAPENEIYEANGGRVFYTSTDQDGNFRTGELFAVEQATGIVTISADFFDLEGLTEISLGGVRLGGTGTVIREFSTDPFFLADSNNIVPTQRAIKAYLQNRLSVGGSDLQVPSFIAGYTRVGPNLITSTIGTQIELPKLMVFGPDAAVNGTMLANIMFHRSFIVD